MMTFLAGLFIPNRRDTQDPAVRQAYGLLCALAGIGWNLLLFTVKTAAGLLSGSISVLADAFNNLSDAGSSVITLIGFRLSAQEPDRDHPFGHGRAEYLAGLAVSGVILVMAVELIRTSFLRILHPEPLNFGWLFVGILAISILVKLYMYAYNRKFSRLIHSAAMGAAATDSLGDVLATSTVLAATLIEHFTGAHIDGWCGILVGGFIGYAGLCAARDTINPLLGQPPDPQFVERIEQIVLSEPLILGLHDLIVHNYGPGRIMISVHAEVDAQNNLLDVHNAVDAVERNLEKQLRCSAVIHMDPVVTGDAETLRLKQAMTEQALRIDPALRLHDFRLLKTGSNVKILFDVQVPYHFRLDDGQLIQLLDEQARRLVPDCKTEIHVDKGEGL